MKKFQTTEEITANYKDIIAFLEKAEIAIPLIGVVYKNQFLGAFNEYTCRNIQVMVSEKEISHEDVYFLLEDKKIYLDENGKFIDYFSIPKGYFDLAFTLSFKLLK